MDQAPVEAEELPIIYLFDKLGSLEDKDSGDLEVT